MRNKFDTQLEQLNNNLISMGAMCESAISSAMKAMLSNDMTLTRKVIELEKDIDQKEKDIETLCLKLLLQQQPVAKDLRLISASLKMITDLERIGDQAADIAEILTFCDHSESESNVHIKKMAEAAMKMVTRSIDAFVNKDINMANEVILHDDIVDELFLEVKNDIIYLIREDASNGEVAVDTLMIAKYLERIADNATNVAEWVVFSITGVHAKGVSDDLLR